MNLRHLVPALGALAFTAVGANVFAEDKAPAVTFSGWSDNLLTVSDVDADDNAATEKDEDKPSIRFSSVESLKVNWTVTDKVSARINAWFSPGTDGLNIREGYVDYSFNPQFTWQMGKYINHVGWISAEPTGLYTVNNSLIGYLGAYGNDVIGTALFITPTDSPISGSVHITNGYFTASDANNTAPSVNRENTDLGFGAGVTFETPDKKINVDLDLAYDMHSDHAGSAAGGLPATAVGGDVFLVGLNATVKPIDNWMFAGEVISQTFDEGDSPAGTVDSETDRLQFMLLANFKFAAWASATLMYQHVEITDKPTGGDVETTSDEIALAFLTNPVENEHFGLNYELAYTTNEFDPAPAPPADDSVDAITFTLEALVTF